MIQKAFRDDAMIAAQINIWHRCFKDGQKSVECDPRSGRAATSRRTENVECIQAAMNKDRQMTVQEVKLISGFEKLLCLIF